MKKSISFVLLAILLLQSCSLVIYQNTPVPITEAVEVGYGYLKRGSVRVTTLSGTDLDFRKIVYSDSNYYGIKEINIKTVLDTTEITAIYLKDIKKTNKKTAVVTVSLIAILTILLLLIPASFSW